MMQSTLKPYFQATGINQVDWAIAPTAQASQNWHDFAQQFPVRYRLQPPTLTASLAETATATAPSTVTPLALQQSTQVGGMQLTLWQTEPAIAQFTFQNQTWLWLEQPERAIDQKTSLPRANILWWSGKTLDPALVQQVQPQVAIATSPAIDPATQADFQQRQIPLFVTGQDGALQWTSATGVTLWQPTVGFSVD